jgi:hypothetical protein
LSTRDEFLEDLAAIVDSWIDSAVSATTNQSADLVWTESPDAFRSVQRALEAANVNRDDVRKVFSECLRGLAVSTLSIVDGATALAEKSRIRIVDDSGRDLGEALHDDFVLHWLNTRSENSQ